MNEDKVFSYEILNDFTYQIFLQVGLRSEDAKTIADHLVGASLRGVDSHGLSRIPIYAKRMREGLVTIDGKIEVEEKGAAAALVNGNNLPGILVAQASIELAVEKAKNTGIAIVGVKHSNHCGMLAAYAKYAVNENMIALLTSNASPSMAPWGGQEKFFGTNPFCYGLPAGAEDAIILDMASSVVAKGKIRIAEKMKEKIPEDWAITHDGRRTTDPTEALQGLVLPMAGPKGYGIVLLNDFLSGIFTGANYGPYIASMFESKRQEVGHCFIVTRPDLFQSLEEYQKKVDNYISQIRQVQKMNGIERIYLPGEIEREKEAIRREEGIPLSKSLYQELRETGSELGVTLGTLT